jgi:hypothetical protein
MTGAGEVPPRRRRGNGRAKAPSHAQPPPPTDEPELAWPDPEIANLWELRAAAPREQPAAPPPDPVAAPPEEGEPTDAEPESSHADRGSRIIMLIAACWVGAIAVIVAGYAIAAPGPTSGPGQIAWPMGAGAPRAEVAGIVQVDETFDDLAVDSKLAAPWTIEGAGPVRIVAIPTGVDRSVRIGADGSGNATALCRPIDVPGGRDARFAFELALGSEPSANVKVIELRRGDATLIEMVLIAATGEARAIRVASGGILVPGSPPARQGGPLDLATWRRVALTVSAGGAVAWEARDSSGTDAGSGTLPESKGSAPLDTFCVLSPTGTPGGWVALDNLLIEG